MMDAIVELGKLRIADPNRSQRSAIEIIRHKYPRVPLGALLEGWEVQSEAANAATGGDGLRAAFQTSAPLAGDMPMGTNVVVKGLVGRADLNGMTARVVVGDRGGFRRQVVEVLLVGCGRREIRESPSARGDGDGGRGERPRRTSGPEEKSACLAP